MLGAGSVGSFIGGAWQAAGLPITLIGRPKIARDIDTYGLTVSDFSGWRVHFQPAQVDYRCGPEALREAQIILVTVKSGATAQAAADIAAHARDGATVISFQNGISNVETLEKVLGGRFEIGQRLFEEMKPRWLRIGGYWYPRGGMPIDVFWQSAKPPEDLWLPDQGVAPYRGRG